MSTVSGVACKSSECKNLSVTDLIALLPHRYPMLLLDRLEDIEQNESAVGVKNVSFNEWFFAGHFPDVPVMPGVLIVEAMAQTSAALVMVSLGISGKDHIVYFMSIAEAKFRSVVRPGDVLRMHVQKQHCSSNGNVWKFKGVSRVNNNIVAEAVYTAMIRAKD